MTDLAQKARHGRLAALGGSRPNSPEISNIFAFGGRFHPTNRPNVVMFLSRRNGQSIDGLV